MVTPTPEKEINCIVRFVKRISIACETTVARFHYENNEKLILRAKLYNSILLCLFVCLFCVSLTLYLSLSFCLSHAPFLSLFHVLPASFSPLSLSLSLSLSLCQTTSLCGGLFSSGPVFFTVCLFSCIWRSFTAFLSQLVCLCVCLSSLLFL